MQTSVARLRARLFRSVVLHPLTLASRSAARHRRLEPGCTVVIVNWNTLRYLVHSVNAVVARSPSSTRILVVDNASADGSQDWVRRHPRAELLALPANVHHGPAMDLGILRCRTRFVVALDVDAFPIRDGWTRCWPRCVTAPSSAGLAIRRTRIHTSSRTSTPAAWR